MNNNLLPHARAHLLELREHVRLLLEWSRQSSLDPPPEFLFLLHFASAALAHAQQLIADKKENP